MNVFAVCVLRCQRHKRVESLHLTLFMGSIVADHKRHQTEEISSNPLSMCCGIPEVCPADLAQGLNVFLADAICLSGQTTLSVLLLPQLALWEHMWGRGAQNYI